jgi:hypothetical protein
VAEKPERDASMPSLDELDSAWSDDDDLDEDATTVAKIPKELVAMSRRGTELESEERPAKAELPEKHEAITARPPPLAGEASVVVDAPHTAMAKSAAGGPEEDGDEDDEDDDEEHEDELAADDLDAGWDVEEERAVAADVAAGLDVEARKKAAEVRAAQRKEKGRAKKIAAKEKRRAHAESIRQKQKKPKKRSTPPPREVAATRSSPPGKGRGEGVPSATREHPTIPPKEARRGAAALAARRDLNRMVFFVALVVFFGALVIGLARR